MSKEKAAHNVPATPHNKSSDVAVTEKPNAAIADEASNKGDLVQAKSTNVEILNPEGIADRMEQLAGKGLENVTAKDILIPRLTILQSLSPQVIKSKPEFMPDAKVGDLCDVGLQELIDWPLHFVPVYFIVQYLEWLPGRKGLAGIHASPDILAKTTINDRKQNVLGNGNIIQETAQFYGLNLNVQMRKCFIAFSSTQLKKGRRWNTLATSEKVTRRDGSEFTPPLFYRSYKLTPVPEQNEQGAWEGWKIERDVKIEELDDASNVFQAALALYDSIIAGRSKADLDSMAAENESGERSM